MGLNYIQESNGRFIFTGYYKQIFDILMLRKGVRSAVVLDPLRERIYFPEADVKIEKSTDVRKPSMLCSYWNLPVEV